MKIINCFLMIICLLVMSACNDNYKMGSTQKMVDYLSKIRDKAIKTELYPYFTKAAIDRYRFDLGGQAADQWDNERLNYALVLLMSGDNIKCIEEITKFLNAIKELDIVSERSIKFHKLLAYAYLREGEQYNCIHHHSSQSCLIPLKEGGIHINKWGAELAIDRYEILLKYDFDDLHSRWFYNLAFMAMGQYPNKVPSQFLIPPESFDSDTLFKTFEDVGMSVGVATNNHAGGCSIDDFNNDGFLDVFTTSYGLLDQSTLYINDGQGSFMDHSIGAGISGLVGGLNCIHGDVNNDGYLDIFIPRGAWLKEDGLFPNSLLLNNGNGSFVDITEESGLFTLNPTGTAAFADIDLDGDLDIFIGNESEFDRIHSCEMYLNNGDGSFENIADELGMTIDKFVKGVVWGDINNDLRPDLYVSIYGDKNLLFVNRTTDPNNPQFQEISLSSGTQEPIYSFPCWFWDVNNDGWQDIMVMSYSNYRPDLIPVQVIKDYLGLPFDGDIPRLYLNNGDETFTEVARNMGLNTALYTMGANFGDLDNDGFSDFYTGNGEFNMLATVPNRMFRNNKGLQFQDVTTAGGFGQVQKGHGIAFGDMDNDGDQDIYHQVGGAAEGDIYHNMLLENPGFESNWITLRLIGKNSNRSAIGTRIKVVTTSGSEIYHWVGTGGSFGANSLQAEIGLGKSQSIDSLIISWPNKELTQDVFTDIAPNHIYKIVEGTKPVEVVKSQLQFKKLMNFHVN